MGRARPAKTTQEEHAMTKAELVDVIHAKAGLPTKAQTEHVLDAIVASLKDVLAAGESISFTGFGSFKVVHRAARKGRNPRTGKNIAIPASKVAKFTPGKLLKEAVKKK
ncbi:MAG: HU family DNA-binding protein [Deltaproteobacteria bacterium]|nr:HU family DNA-binding protein [Deltaproteobacteria bacterium]